MREYKLDHIEIIQLRAEGYSYRAIADCMMMSASVVGKIFRQWKATRLVKNSTCLGKPQKIRPIELRRLNRVAENNPCVSLAEITNESRLNCHAQTIQKALHKLDFHLRISRGKPFLNAGSKRKRLIWCRHRRYWIVEDWCRKFYSDEAKVEIGVGGGYERVWHISKKRNCVSGKSRPRPDARCPPVSPRTPGASEFSIHCPLAPTVLQHPSFLLISLRIGPQSAPPPDAIHLLPSLLPAPNDLPFLLFFLWICPQSASPRRHSSSSLPFFLHPITSHFALFFADPSAVRSPP